MKTIWTQDDQVLEPRGENVNASLKQVVKKVGARIFVSVFFGVKMRVRASIAIASCDVKKA